MSQSTRPRRSVLFVPADNQRALQKINPQLAADCIVIDLEDAVSNDNKGPARAALLQQVAQMDTGGRELLLRINSSDSVDYLEDVALAASLAIDAVVLPKVEHPEQVQQLAQALPADKKVWAMIETARGVINADAICSAHPKLAAMMMGTQDLGLDLQLRPGVNSSQIIEHCLMQCVLAARAAGIAAIDAVCPEFNDLEPLREQCRGAVARGYDGKSAIHPKQLMSINASFSPDPAQLDHAHAIMGAWQEAKAQGLSVAKLDGRMIEELHATQASLILQQAVAIANLHDGS